MMRLLKRGISYDPFLGDEDAREAGDALANGDWIPTMALMRDTQDHSLRLNMLTSEAVPTEAFHLWVDAHPTGLSLTMLAMRQMTEAWAIGRTRPGERTQDEIDEAFRAQLRIADRSVALACGKDHDMADAWAAAVPIATGLGFGMESAARRFERAHSLHAFHRNATISMLRAHFARWGGSDESLFEFARLVSENTAPDSEVQSVLPIAHLEFVSAHDNEVVHFAGRDTKRELKGVVSRFLEAAPSGPAPPEQLEVLNTFVAVLGRVRPLPENLLSECITRIDDRPTPIPWRRGDNDLSEAYASFVKNLR